MKLVINYSHRFVLNSLLDIFLKTILQFQKFLYFKKKLNLLYNQMSKDSQILLMMKFQIINLKD